jgi:hypothetical protein
MEVIFFKGSPLIFIRERYAANPYMEIFEVIIQCKCPRSMFHARLQGIGCITYDYFSVHTAFLTITLFFNVQLLSDHCL